LTARLILSLLAVVFFTAFTCNAQTQPSATPTEDSLRNQCKDLLAARGYAATSEAGVWTKTVSGVTQTWKLSKITVQAPAKAGEPCYGFILLDQYEAGDPNPHGSFAEGFVWEESSRTWAPLLPSVIVNP
jgi:hypothetical protein